MVNCKLCDDTGAKDYAGFAMDPCYHGVRNHEDLLVDAITDSLDMDWSPSLAIGPINRALEEQKLAIMPVAVEAALRSAILRLETIAETHPEIWLESDISGYRAALIDQVPA